MTETRQSETPTLAPSIALRAGELTLELTAAGEIGSIRHAAEDLSITLYHPGVGDRAVGGVWLRRHRAGEVALHRLVGSEPGLRFEVGARRVAWSGEGLGVHHRVALTLHARGWVWDVRLEAGQTQADDRFDVVVAQDVALAPPGAALSSEPYTSQYVAHRILTHRRDGGSDGVALASRQTMSAGPRLPLLVSAICGGADACLTDAAQVYTPRARRDGLPHGLLVPDITPQVLQEESALPTLVSPAVTIGPDGATVRAFAVFAPDERGDLPAQARFLPAWEAEATTVAQQPLETAEVERTVSGLGRATLLSGREMSTPELLALGDGSVLLPEHDEAGGLLSYFTTSAAHVVSGAKETVVQRSHGHVLRTGGPVEAAAPVLSTTCYAPGCFASHVVLGNTSANRLTTVHRSPENLLRSTGVRVLVARPGTTERWLLGCPSAIVFETSSVRWTYLTAVGRIDVRTTTASARHGLDVVVTCETPLDVQFTVDLERADGGPAWEVSRTDARTVTVTPVPTTTIAAHCPDLAYALGASHELALGADGGLLVMDARETTRCVLGIAGSMKGSDEALRLVDEQRRDADGRATGERHREQLDTVTRGLRLSGTSRVPTDELNILTTWFTDNALTHLLAPHGLEQYSGAAWGTRDVCQGPFELALAFGHFELARRLLLIVLAHQHEDGQFPQWFMFDEYADVYADDSHGDVPVWPLFALGEYLDATGDTGVLDAVVPFWDHARRRPGTARATVADHLERLHELFSTETVAGTHLPAYGHGDWDDTLQPADARLRTAMASSWTAALLVQAARSVARHLHTDLGERLGTLADRVETDLRAYALVGGTMAGFVVRGENPHLLIHPDASTSRISYRLIPMTQSVLAEVFDAEEAAHHERLIREHLRFPDGVRLMDRPATYHDGVPTTFLRAEQAASVGREIGLLYTHAHLRWAEMLATLGRPSTLDELLLASPVAVTDRVLHAEPRQRNTYYSSSDGAFPDRYAFEAGFERLRTGEVPVRGGWRVYSSGPGIYLRLLVQRVLGIQLRARSVVFDPVLAPDADGLEVELRIDGRDRHIVYRVDPEATEVTIDAGDERHAVAPVAGTPLHNRFRDAGVEVDHAALGAHRWIQVTVPVRPTLTASPPA